MTAEDVSAPPRRVARWRYVVPNAITCAGLLVGLLAVFRSMEGDHVEAAWLIILCVLIDKLDGTAARALKATSEIGLQLDSLADFVTFGIAPGSLIFTALYRGQPGNVAGLGPLDLWHGPVTNWVLHILVAAYVLAACIRLAKFNVLTELESNRRGPKVFYGLPTTFSGGMIASFFLLGTEYRAEALIAWSPVVAIVLAVLMLSNIPMPKLQASSSRLFNVVLGINVVGGYVCGAARLFPEYLLGLQVVYLVCGMVWGFSHRTELAPTRSLDPYPP